MCEYDVVLTEEEHLVLPGGEGAGLTGGHLVYEGHWWTLSKERMGEWKKNSCINGRKM